MSHMLIRTSDATAGIPHKTDLGSIAFLGRQVRILRESCSFTELFADNPATRTAVM
eukprot:m.221760 g.221760  ORF g.221760 m.221760 type:complete len:56 (-) comp15617_c0_seq6:1872-2039(-)